MTPAYTDDAVTLYGGDCLNVLSTLPDCSVDAVVTDPPYLLGFMGREWDTRAAADHLSWHGAWSAECLRVLKPGGHLLAFGGTRTYHRLACAVEDAGFEIRDSIVWLYGSGFPKSLDVGKAIDKAAGAQREVVGPNPYNARRPNPPVSELHQQAGWPGDVTVPATASAKQWDGWGTALKPASEPIVVARKPLTGTVAQTVLAYGTGALNIDGCRVEGVVPSVPQPIYGVKADGVTDFGSGVGRNGQMSAAPGGRWPANVVLTHTPDCQQTGTRRVKSSNAGSNSGGFGGGMFGDGVADRIGGGHADADGTETVAAFVCVAGCPVAELDQQSGTRTSGKPSGLRGANSKASVSYADIAAGSELTGYGDSGGASRFFPTFRYQAKAPASQRPKLADGTAHPTVKPLDLMRWLVRLVTPPGGTVLDPFAGSGTTLQAATIEGFTAVGVERDDAYLAMCRARLAKPVQGGLFGEAVS